MPRSSSAAVAFMGSSASAASRGRRAWTAAPRCTNARASPTRVATSPSMRAVRRASAARASASLGSMVRAIFHSSRAGRSWPSRSRASARAWDGLISSGLDGTAETHAPSISAAPRMAVRLAVRLHVEAFGGEALELIPGQRVTAGTDVIRVDEERGREAELLQHRVGVLAEGLIAVVERQHDRFPRQLALELQPVDELRQRHHVVALTLEVAHLLGEGIGAEHEPAFRLGTEVVIDEDRHELIAGGVHARDVPRSLRNDHALAGLERARAAVEVLDHPRLGRIAQVRPCQRLSRLAVVRGDDDDEVVRLAHHGRVGLAARRAAEPQRGAAAEGEDRDDEAQRTHRPRTSYTSISSSLPLTFMSPSDLASTRSRTAS